MAGQSQVELRTALPSDLEALHAALNTVAAEKWVIATVQFSLEDVRAFLEKSVKTSLPHALALEGETVVGWCDIVPGKPENGFGHIGRLGMWVRREWRRRGIGRSLLERCLQQASQAGLEKIELEVYPENLPAVLLYKRFGFLEEGLRRRARKLDGRYQDIQQMALWLTDPPPPR
jgi:ribosomal protein S18 acetylase RimI-like enzyme